MIRYRLGISLNHKQKVNKMNAKRHYSIIDNEAYNIIEHAKTPEQAKQIIAEYEAADKKDGTYTPKFYSIREERDNCPNDAWVKLCD